ncbi:hypothetical protein MSG28_008932 [Choristoneura fumiferana]|uniref:Uncharacterized protein n=1 Tax=Choristoneura fumiferana TaxID=7141 RepID=A0ACC0J8J3_CHOFU|nr:hypothetical protein MSG28_008932 [Choristoneura fumiferana]
MANSEEKLRNVLQRISKEQGYKDARIDIKPISSGGANYTTCLYLATISESFKPNLNLFAKVANLGEEIRVQNEMMAKVYMKESVFYTELAVNFERLYQKNNVPAEHRLVIPKYYGHVLTRLEETLVLENLEASGFGNFDRMKTYNWEYAAASVQQMARFHALGLALRNENPAEFEKMVAPFYVDILSKNGLMQIFLQQVINNSCEVVTAEQADRVRKYFSQTEILAESMKRFMEDKTMLIHGDYRPSNLMQKRRNGKLQIVPLDFQTLKMGNPVSDFMYFIFSGSDEEFRRLHYQRLLDHYYTELSVALQKLNIDVEKVYPRKNFDNDLIESRPMALILGLAMAPLVTVAPEDAPKIDANITEMVIKPNELAQERIRGIVRDFTRWGII